MRICFKLLITWKQQVSKVPKKIHFYLWHECSTVAGMISQQSLSQLFNSYWHDWSTVIGSVDRWSFNNGCHEFSTVTGNIVQQSLAQLFNSHWYDWSTVFGTILQQWLALFYISHWHNCSTVTGKISFFYPGRFPDFQWCSLLKGHAMHQEYDTWSVYLKEFPEVFSLTWTRVIIYLSALEAATGGVL